MVEFREEFLIDLLFHIAHLVFLLCILADLGNPGAASVLYALASLVFGALASWRTEAMLPVYIAAELGLFFSALFFAPHREKPKQAEADGSLLRVFARYPKFVLFCIGNFVLVIPHTFLNSFLASITQVTGGDMSVMIAVAALVEFPAMMAYSHIRKRVPDRIMLVLSASVYLLKTGLLLLAAYCPIGSWAVYVSSALQMLCYALFIPAASYYANDTVSECDRVKGQMLLTEASLLAGVVSMLLGGFALEALGVGRTLIVCEALVAAGVCVVWLGLRKGKQIQ